MGSESRRLSILTVQEVNELYDLPCFTEEDRHLYFDLSPVERELVDGVFTISVSVHLILQLGYFKAKRTSGRPPPIQRLPFRVPLSRVQGARPAKAATSRRFKRPSSGIGARTLQAVRGPTPWISSKHVTRCCSAASCSIKASICFSTASIWASRWVMSLACCRRTKGS